MPKVIEHAREAILATTRGLLRKEGYEALNVRAIATASGIGIGTVYNYFRAKDEIVFALMNEDWRLTLTRMDEALDGRMATGSGAAGDRAGLLALVFHPLVDFIREYRGIWAILAAAPPEQKSPGVRRHDNALFLEEIGERVGRIVTFTRGEGSAFTLRFIVRSLATWALEVETDFDKLGIILSRVMEVS